MRHLHVYLHTGGQQMVLNYSIWQHIYQLKEAMTCSLATIFAGRPQCAPKPTIDQVRIGRHRLGDDAAGLRQARLQASHCRQPSPQRRCIWAGRCQGMTHAAVVGGPAVDHQIGAATISRDAE